MSTDKSDKSINTSDLPQSETFKKEEVYQQKQPADTGKALNQSDEKENKDTANGVAEEDKSSKEDGLNEHNSKGDAGAFEGFEEKNRIFEGVSVSEKVKEIVWDTQESGRKSANQPRCVPDRGRKFSFCGCLWENYPI